LGLVGVMAHLVRDVPLLRADKRPNLIALDAPARQAAQMVIHVGRAHCTQFQQQLLNRILRNVGHSHRGPDRVAFHQGRDYLSASLWVQAIHNGPIV
jgi:hypothetical protein